MRLLALPLVVLVLAGCGGHAPRTPEEVARAWSAAIDRGDDGAAAKLFAPGAQVVQADAIALRTPGDALRWNRALPCGGRITRVIPHGPRAVIVVFHLVERPGHRCDGPGQDTAALFKVVNRKIVLWFQTPVPQRTPAGQIV
jgi:hypothetical protein